MDKINFITWLRQQSKRNDSVGDVARDTVADKECNCKTYESFKRYFETVHACNGAMRSLDRAYKEYCKLEG
jgi:hypothetical protein